MLVDRRSDQALLVRLAEKAGRAVEGPSQKMCPGPHDAFNEDVRSNIALLRKRLNTSRLAVETWK